MFTLVSGFINISAYDAGTKRRRDERFYLEHGRVFLKLPIPKVVFLESTMIKYLEGETFPPQTLLVPFEKEEIELWPMRQQLLALPGTHDNGKDTHDYFIVMHQKLPWCLRAIELNPYKTEHFMWLDFGANYLMKHQPLATLMNNVTFDKVRPGTIRFPGRQPVDAAKAANAADTVAAPLDTGLIWHFCGTMFAGDASAMQQFYETQSQILSKIIEQGHFTWEVTTWYHCARNVSNLFDWYYATHWDESMLLNF